MPPFRAFAAIALLAGCMPADEPYAGNALTGDEIARPIPLAPGETARPSSDTIPGAIPLLLPLAFADFERMDLLGAGCTWRSIAPGAGGDAPTVFVALADKAAVKIDGRDTPLAPDPASSTLPEGAYGVKTRYRGGGIAIEIRRAEGEWEPTGPETREAAADLIVTSDNGASGKLSPGALSCGA